MILLFRSISIRIACKRSYKRNVFFWINKIPTMAETSESSWLYDASARILIDCFPSVFIKR